MYNNIIMLCTSACMVKVRVLWILIKLLLKDDHKKCGVDFIFRIAEHTVLCIHVHVGIRLVLVRTF